MESPERTPGPGDARGELGPDDRMEFAVHYTIPGFDGFFRSHPAILEGPEERWRAAQSVIDFGTWLLLNGPGPAGERALREAVLIALLRRALVTAEGIRLLLAHGLEEPALAATRTLLDIELAVKLITGDTSNRMAERLAAWHYYSSQKHGQRMLGSRETRAAVTKDEGGSQHTVDVARSYARFLELPVFDAVREEVRGSPIWHGFKNVEAAFEAVGAVSDYHVLYDLGTFFVHDTNVDYDYSEVRTKTDGSQEFVLRALVERDPSRLRASLGSMVLRLHGIIRMYVEDRGIADDIERKVERNTKGLPSAAEPGSEPLTTMAGLTTMVLDHFGDLGPDDDFRVTSRTERTVDVNPPRD